MSANTPSSSDYIQRFSLRVEAALRHAFLAELYSYLWKVSPATSLQVFTADADDMGFDLLLTANGQIRHVQLKSSFVGSATKAVRIRDSLLKQKGGCILGCHHLKEDLRIQNYSFLGYTHDKEELDLTLFPPARDTRADSTGKKKLLQGTRLIPWTTFHQNLNIATVALCLFHIQQPPKPLT